MTAIQAYILAKKFAQSAVSGVTNVTFDGDQLVFELADGTSFNVSVPIPEDGVSITDVKIQEGHLICTMSDKTTIDAGEISGSSGSNIIQVSSYDKLPPQGNTDNLYITTDSDNCYYYNGTDYVSLASTSGDIEWQTI